MQACALRLIGEGHGPLSVRQVAKRMSIAHTSALNLIRKGLARIEAHGFNAAPAAARAA